ncbi:MAG: acyl-CoA dehydratase activase-related protein, partial [Candidatus Symbiothrix sp.]|jgi:predicted nucleotide-binding protein (sugar kinase/HSP70/actin superfamily)|nr:acyl-CoA dehydratase activase-related protein [Candidatus Symbiothrix sp.]
MNFGNLKILKKQCFDLIADLTRNTRNPDQQGIPAKAGMTKRRFEAAFKKALLERQNHLKNLIEPQQKILDKALKNNELTFIVAGRPYHTDPLIQQKVGQILSDLGAHALTDDVFRRRNIACNVPTKGFENLNLVSQWSYPNRVIQTALEVAKLPQNVQMVQLNSFGCGPDSFFLEETGEILKSAGKNHTVLRIDEIASPGSIRLRLRSLIESLKAN